MRNLRSDVHAGSGPDSRLLNRYSSLREFSMRPAEPFEGGGTVPHATGSSAVNRLSFSLSTLTERFDHSEGSEPER